jgi:hypothetical protein
MSKTLLDPDGMPDMKADLSSMEAKNCDLE